jgi:hypothetical protein
MSSRLPCDEEGEKGLLCSLILRSAFAEETRIIALGLGEQPRLSANQKFVVSAFPVTEPHRLGASMVLDGRQFYLNQVIATSSGQWLVGRRALLTNDGEHAGRKVKVAYKVADGVAYQIMREDRNRYVVLRHGAGWLELSEPPEPYESGYMVIIFQ